MAATPLKLRNVGPKSAAWLRQVGVRTQEDIGRIGPVEVFLKVKRAGFRPSLNLLYALAGAVDGCHWADLTEERKSSLILDLDAAETANPIRTRWEKAAAASERSVQGADGDASDDAPAASLFDDPDADHAGASSEEGGASRFD